MTKRSASSQEGRMSDERWHGTAGGYHNHACRCEDCKRAQAAYMKDYRSRLILNIGDSRHGTVNGYANYRCRCAACRAAKSGSARARREASK